MKPNSPENAKSQPTLTIILTQIGRVLFLFIGLISCFITIFMIMTGNYTKIFDTTMITSCASSPFLYTKNAYNYLNKINTLQKLVVVLDLTALCLFTLAITLSISKNCCKNNKAKVYAGLFVIKSILNSLLILSTGTLFGNVVKTLMSLNLVYNCTNSQVNVEHFFTNSQTLALLTGISLFAALINFFIPPFRLKKPSQRYQIRDEALLEPNSNNFMLGSDRKEQSKVLKNNQQQTAPPKRQIQPQIKSGHKPRIFGRQFLTETRYGHASRTNKSKQANNNSPRIYDVSSDLLNNNQDMHLNFNLQKQEQLDMKITPRYKTSNLIQSHLVPVPEGPPIQLGEFITPVNAQQIKLMTNHENDERMNKKPRE